jgi:hypothetical protein
LVWAGAVIILLVGARVTASMEGDRVDWAVVIPVALVIPAVAVAGALYGNYRSERHGRRYR